MTITEGGSAAGRISARHRMLELYENAHRGVKQRAVDELYEKMLNYLQFTVSAGKREPILGWAHDEDTAHGVVERFKEEEFEASYAYVQCKYLITLIL